MRLSLLTSLAFASTIFAAPSTQIPAQEITDVKFIRDAYADVLGNAYQLVDKITNLKPEDDVIARLKEMSVLSGSTLKITEKMTGDIKALSGKLSSQAAFLIATPSAEVAQTTVQIINDLVAKKQIFVKAGVHKIVSDDLNNLYNACVKFVDAAKAKIPDTLVGPADEAFKKTLESLEKGVKNFASAN
jgi:Hydrophobic surface binding protein A